MTPMRCLTLVAVLLLTTFNVAHAAQPYQPPEMSPLVPSRQTAPTISKATWLEKLHTQLPARICHERSVIQHCFTIDQGHCERFSQTITSACLNALGPKLPDTLSELDQKKGIKLAKACTYDLFEKVLAEKKVAHPQCRDLAKQLVQTKPAPPQPTRSLDPAMLTDLLKDAAAKMPRTKE